MASCQTTARKFQDFSLPIDTVAAMQQAELNFDDDQADPNAGKMVSFVSLHHHDPNGQVYCGLTSLANQILVSFDPDTKQFADLAYQDREFCERYDVKIHRSFEADGEGGIFFAVAGLHQLKTNPDAPGGRIFRLDPETGRIDFIARPVKRDYIQTIAYDKLRKVFYGNCYPLRNSFGYDMKNDRTFDMAEPVNSHKARCDNEGNLWGISHRRTRPLHNVREDELEVVRRLIRKRSVADIPVLFRYNPEDGYQYLPEGLPVVNAFTQSIANGIDIGDGGMYLTTELGGLYRVDKQTGESQEYAFHRGGRLEGIAYDADRGLLFCAGGAYYATHVFVVDVEKKKRITPFWPVADHETAERCIIVHALTLTKRNGTYLVYIGETDNPNRAGHLWECQIKL